MNPKTIQDPPSSFFGKLRFLGPGFILSASIVGSGELIATTLLGAKAGFVTFWVILVSCLVKVAIQLEFGKNSIVSGNSLMHEFNQLSGPKVGRSNWAVWSTFILTSLKILQIGGMLGGSAIVLNLIVPTLPVTAWLILLAVSLALLIYKNYYRLIEKASTLMVFGFTLFTIASLVAIFYTPFGFSFKEVMSGLTFDLPQEAIFVAIAAFGITGVASDEIIAYTYWCQEKGYAAFVGQNDGSETWKKRARGWIKIMYLDAFLAMVIYTLVTAAFYLLGAAILYGQGEFPDGNDLITYLASIYTQSLGSDARLIYLAGAFFALYSSIFASLAYWSRLYPDVFCEFGWMRRDDERQRKKSVRVLAWAFPVIWTITYLFIKLPGIMVLSGGLVASVLLLIVVAAAIKFRAKNRDLKLTPGFWSDLMFWISAVSILSVSAYGIFQLF